MEKETRSIEDRMKERESEATEDGKAGRYTPGPWKRMSSATIDGANGEYIALIQNHLPNAEANARLIAAAPELLEAVKLALIRLQGTDEAEILMDAIEKAEGR